jgi:hypothetical protein
MLLAAFLALTVQWRSVFRQQRLWSRAQRQALGALLVLGRATLARILWANGREQHSWSAEYFPCTLGPNGIRRRCFGRCSKRASAGVPGGWWAWRWMIPVCAKPAVAYRRLPTIGIPCRRRFTLT